MKKILLILLILVCQKAYCADQVISANLPLVLSIEKIIVEQFEYDRDEPLINMQIKQKMAQNPNYIQLILSPVKVQIHTNSSTPVKISALFKELKHDDGINSFSSSQLGVSPASYTINNPYDNQISDVFVPYAYVMPNTKKGLYRGVLTFTLGAI